MFKKFVIFTFIYLTLEITFFLCACYFGLFPLNKTPKPETVRKESPGVIYRREQNNIKINKNLKDYLDIYQDYEYEINIDDEGKIVVNLYLDNAKERYGLASKSLENNQEKWEKFREEQQKKIDKITDIIARVDYSRDMEIYISDTKKKEEVLIEYKLYRRHPERLEEN